MTCVSHGWQLTLVTSWELSGAGRVGTSVLLHVGLSAWQLGLPLSMATTASARASAGSDVREGTGVKG